jgi:hypothetical protein
MKRRLVTLLAASAIGACSSATTTTDGGTQTASCYVATQQICYEDPSPTASQAQNLSVKCSSDSGQFLQPAACPQTGFLGKCTATTSEGVEIQRFYTGADATYQADFCANVSLGVWSTTF